MLEKKAILSKFESYNDAEYLIADNAKQEKRSASLPTQVPSKREEDPDKKVYPLSLYNTQTKQHENFMKSIRQRNDTFYYVSFRRVSLRILLTTHSI